MKNTDEITDIINRDKVIKFLKNKILDPINFNTNFEIYTDLTGKLAGFENINFGYILVERDEKRIKFYLTDIHNFNTFWPCYFDLVFYNKSTIIVKRKGTDDTFYYIGKTLGDLL